MFFKYYLVVALFYSLEILLLKELIHLNFTIEILNLTIRLGFAFASYYLLKHFIFPNNEFLHLRFPVAVGLGPLVSSTFFTFLIKFNFDINILFLKFIADLSTSLIVYYFLSRP